MADTQLVFVPKDDPISYQEVQRDSRYVARYIHMHNSHELCFVPSHTAFQAFSGGNRWDLQGPALVFHRAGCYHELLSVGEGEIYKSQVVHFFKENLPSHNIVLPDKDCSILPLSEDEAATFGTYFSLISCEPLPRQQLALLLILDRLAESNHRTIGGDAVDSYIFSLLRQIATTPEETPSIQQLADQYHVSPSKLKQDFYAITAMPVRRYITRQRLQLARKLLKQKDLSITQIAFKCGFCSQSHFIAIFRQHFGVTPGQFRKELS